LKNDENERKETEDSELDIVLGTSAKIPESLNSIIENRIPTPLMKITDEACPGIPSEDSEWSLSERTKFKIQIQGKNK